MTDKEKIRAEIERRIEEEQRINKEKEKLTGVGSVIDTRYESLLSFIDSMQEEPTTSVWHNAKERPNYNTGHFVLVGYKDDDELYNGASYHVVLSSWISRRDLNNGRVVRWAYLDDLLKL